MEQFGYSRWLTYERVVLEFLSTLELITKGKKKEGQVLFIHFHLGAVSYEKSVAWVNHVYGFRAGATRVHEGSWIFFIGSDRPQDRGVQYGQAVSCPQPYVL
ncbi:hypothetical protein Droror1_Dr00023610, partial [Drosera rotundifolia]